MKRVVIVGGRGQVGTELRIASWPDPVVILAPSSGELDISNAASVESFFAQIDPDLVINAAAYTGVDAAEENPGAAFAINCLGAGYLAEATRRKSKPFIHLSTDYVFDGAKGGYYHEADPIAPLGVYGSSKAAGEMAVRSIHARAVILRTSWLVSPHRTNFLNTMLRLATERDKLGVVDDQRGCPTVAVDLAAALVRVALAHLEDPDAPHGIFHFVNNGDASWYELAEAIFATAAERGMKVPMVDRIKSHEYPTTVRRPADSRLATTKLREKFEITPRHWREAVAESVNTVLRQG